MAISSYVTIHGVVEIRASTLDSYGSPIMLSLADEKHGYAHLTLFLGDTQTALASRLVDAINNAMNPPEPAPGEEAAYIAASLGCAVGGG